MQIPERKSYGRRQHSAMDLALKRVRQAPGSLIRAADLDGVTAGAASKALARLAERGTIQRVRNGVYYVPKKTLLGQSKPTEPAMVQKVLDHRARPTGVTAANLLGLTTQLAGRPEFVAYTLAPPRGLETARLRLRPRAHTVELEPRAAALLEFIRDRGKYGELSAEETYARIRAILQEAPAARMRKLRDAALLEPPRVRAILGSLLEFAELPEALWKPLRESLNGLSRFDFGLFKDLPGAREWQAK